MREVTVVQMDASIATRLSAAKQLYFDGDTLRTRADDAGKIQAAIMMDGAVESVLKTVLAHAKQPRDEKTAFYKLVKVVAPFVPSAPAFVVHREVRNDAQHDGIIPRREALDAMSADARTCLEQGFTACGTAFARFTLVDFVQNAETLVYLHAAIDAADQAPEQAIHLAHYALQWIRHMGAVLTADAFDIEVWHDAPHRGETKVSATADGRAMRTKEMLDVVTSASFGFELPDYVYFMHLVRADASELVADDAWWSIDYAARHAYRLEQTLPAMTVLTRAETTMTERASLLPSNILR